MSNVAFANQITALHLHHQHPQQQTLTLKKHLFPALPIKSTRKHVHSNSTSTTKCIIEAFNSMKIEADFQNPVASGSFGDVFFGTLHPSNDPVVLKRSRPSKTARTLFSIEKKINQKLLTSKTEEIHSACQRWPVYLGDYVKDSEFFMVWKRDNDGQTLEDYLFSKPISHLYKIFNTTYSQSTNHQNSLRIPLFKNVLYNLLLALQDIHNLGIVHRDIKPSNLLITTSSDHNIKLIDFGSACQVSSILWSRGIDTLDPLWAPPETRLSLLAPKQFDVFSAALIGLTVLLPTLSNEMRLKEFRNILQTYNFDLRAYRTQWLNYKKSGNDADNDLAALFNQDDDRAKDVFYLLCAMLKNSPTERCSVEAALYSLSSLSS